VALVVAHHDYGAEGKPPAALDDFGDARDVYHALVKFIRLVTIAILIVSSRHT
jgi:hypothetical protein